MVRHLPSTNLAIPSLISGNRITLEHGLKHHFGTQPFLPHFGTKARTQPLYHPLWKIMEFVRWDHSSHMVPVTYSQIPWFQSPPTRFLLDPFKPTSSNFLTYSSDLQRAQHWRSGAPALFRMMGHHWCQGEGEVRCPKNRTNIGWYWLVVYLPLCKIW
jgi:hypothetical protein